MRPLVPHLWFPGNAEEAAAFGTDLLPASRVVRVVPHGPDSPGVEGTTMSVEWQMLGHRFGPCGWVTDRFGSCWQVTPAVLPDLLDDQDPERVRRVTQYFLGLDGVPFSLADPQAAYDGEPAARHRH